VQTDGFSTEGERRHLTVLFCDLVGSTEIAVRLDPEEWHEIAREYHREASLAVERFGGHVAKFLGDGILAYFGWPRAHDNDPERGVRAGLALLESIAALSSRLRQVWRPELSVRVGIHSGPTVIAEAGKDGSDIFGDTPNIAAHVQATAAPGTVVITPATRYLVSGLFLLEDLGTKPIKGLAEPLELSRAVRAAGVSDQLSRSARSLPPFVGRDDELRMLLNRFERVREGEGQTVLITGEAGIGKTRLINEFRARIAAERHTWIDTAADPFFGSTPFHPLKQAVDHALRWSGDESDDEKIALLEASMTSSGLALDQAFPLVARMFDLPVPAKYAAVLLSPEQERNRLLATLAAWTLGSARTQPVVIVLEDLHWADPSTLDLVRMLVEQCATAPLFVVITARPEFDPVWARRAHHLLLTLSRLSDREARRMIEGIATKLTLMSDVIDTVVHRSSGVPLFVEELTRLVLDEGAKSASRDVPATLIGSLLARLDRLGEARAVAETAAVLGRDFDYQMLHAVAGLSHEKLQEGLQTLADADLVYMRGVPPDAVYRFKHALVRDAAYELLLKSRRRELHAAIAAAIQKSFSAHARAQPELVAHHFAEAGDYDEACKLWKVAGENAASRGAFRESEGHFRQAIAALALLPESDKRSAREVQLQLELGQVLAASRGYSAPETAAAYSRARALSNSFDSGSPAALLLGLWAVAIMRGDLEGARQLADHALQGSRSGGRRVAQSWAHYSQGLTRFFRGDLREAESQVLRSVELDDGEGAGAFPQNPRIDSLAVAGSVAWLLGRPDTAVVRVSQAWKDAHELNLPFDVAFVGPWICSVLIWREEFQRALETAEQLLAISTEHHFPLFVALAKMYKGSALCALGSSGEGIAMMRDGLAGGLAVGRGLALPELLTWLAEGQMRAGALSDSASTLDDALSAAPAELYWRPETLRLRGEVTLKLARSSAEGLLDIAKQHNAERDFMAACSLAAQIGARSLELRATTSLARLLAKQGKRDEARAMLASVYGWFAEGFDTADLKDAKALLEELSNSP
jgi:class 3 adenylate cyclase/tetratricopeptide (TPR) repeat protein